MIFIVFTIIETVILAGLLTFYVWHRLSEARAREMKQARREAFAAGLDRGYRDGLRAREMDAERLDRILDEAEVEK